MSNSRLRSAIFKPERVHEIARANNINTKRELETLYDTAYETTESYYSVSAVDKAWNGKKLDFKYANQIAYLLGLENYFSLLDDQGRSRWEEIIYSSQYQSKFLKFVLTGDASKGLFDIPNRVRKKRKDLDAINILERWFLKLSGKPNQHFMAVLLSEEHAFQLAPLSHEIFINVIPSNRNELRYPIENTLPFSPQHGTGWRRLIVIRSQHIPVEAKSTEAGSLEITAETLESYARSLFATKITFDVDQYEFMVVDTPTKRHQ